MIKSYTKYMKPFLQSDAWKKFQEAYGREVYTDKGKTWSYLAIAEKGRLSNRLYSPYGPIISGKSDLKEAVNSLKAKAKQTDASFIRIEPVGIDLSPADMTKLGFKKAHKETQPSHTVVNDVSISPEDIMAGTSQTVRRIWRKNEKAGVKYEVSYDPKDIKDFINMIHNVSDRTGMIPYSDKYFKITADSLFPDKDAGLLFAVLDKKRIAAILFYNTGQTMYYAHAASYSEYRKISPATSLALYSLIFAHEEGCKEYDFCGVAPEGADKSHRWSGFTSFKLAFGGERRNTVGTWELPIKKGTYRLYRLLLKISS